MSCHTHETPQTPREFEFFYPLTAIAPKSMLSSGLESLAEAISADRDRATPKTPDPDWLNARRNMDDSELMTICTSHVERNNLTIRTFMRRITRLALGFSKKIENLEAAVNLHVAYFNFCWRPGTMRITPAMAAGITPRLWTSNDLLA